MRGNSSRERRVLGQVDHDNGRDSYRKTMKDDVVERALEGENGIVADLKDDSDIIVGEEGDVQVLTVGSEREDGRQGDDLRRGGVEDLDHGDLGLMTGRRHVEVCSERCKMT